MTAVAWSPFTGALYDVPADLLVRGDGDATVRIPATWSVLRHPAGVMLIDAGAPPAGSPGGDDVAARPAGSDVRTALRLLGLRPDDVSFVLLTHLHVDHLGGLDAVPGARLLTTAEEVRYARAPDVWMEPEYPAAARDLGPRRVDLVDDGQDVFGDGTVTVVATPGHTPGHVSVLLRLPDTGAVLLPGDAAWTRRTLLDDAAVPGLLWDEEAWLASRARLRRLAVEERARIFYTHEPEQVSAGAWQSGGRYR